MAEDPNYERGRALGAALATACKNGEAAPDVVKEVIELVSGDEREVWIRALVNGLNKNDWLAEPLRAMLLTATTSDVRAVDVLISLDLATSRGLASDPDTPATVVGVLSTWPDTETVWLAAGHPAIPAAAATDLIAGTLPSVIRALASNESLPPSVRSAAAARLVELLDQSAPPSAEEDVSQPDQAEVHEGTAKAVWDFVLAGDPLAPFPPLADETEPGEVLLHAMAHLWVAESVPEHAAVELSEALRLLTRVSSIEGDTFHARLFAESLRYLIVRDHGLGGASEAADSLAAMWGEEIEGFLAYGQRSLVFGWQMPPGSWLENLQLRVSQATDEACVSIPFCGAGLARQRGLIDEAERHLRDALRERAAWVYGSALNTLVFSILIPQGRFDEAELLLATNVASTTEQEGENSRSNLGVIAYGLGEFTRAERLFTLVRESRAELVRQESAYHLAMMLLAKGKTAAAKELFVDAANGDGSEYGPMAKVELARLVAADSSASPSDSYWAGSQFAHAKEYEPALHCLRRAARAGEPNALSSLTWFLIGWGEPAAAITAWQECAAAVQPWLAELEAGGASPDDMAELRRQIPNFTSNVALALAATGDSDGARRMWLEAGGAGHAEASFQLAILDSREGRDREARAAVGILTRDQRDAMHSFLADIERDFPNSEWLHTWVADGRTLLDRPD